MRLCCITNTVNHFHNSIKAGVITDSVITASNIVINSARKSYARNTSFAKVSCTTERTVAAYNNNALNTVLLAGTNCFSKTFFCSKLNRTSRVKDSTATIDNVWYASKVHFNEIAVDKTVIATNDTVNLNSVFACCTYYCTNSCIHTRCVAATC